MQIKQWEDKNLAQYSYAVVSDCERKVVLIDPARNPQPYLEWAKEHEYGIIGIIETHPHADFVSSHLELHQLTGAPVYVHSLVGALYPHEKFDEGAVIEFGKIKLRPLYTPGHSPDSISILLEHDGKQKAVFTGDTLFIGDCGRPDLREGAGSMQATREELAGLLYHSLREKLLKLEDQVLVYPAHGAGTLCGKSLSKESSSTIGAERQTNWCLQETTKDEFISNLLTDQPFVPAYFPYNVELNRRGAASFSESIARVKRSGVLNPDQLAGLDPEVLIIDAREAQVFRQGHLPRAINLMEGGKFETWLGSIVKPGEPFYLTGESGAQLDRLIARAAAIGYEQQIKEVFIMEGAPIKNKDIDLSLFRRQPEAYTIVDVRNDTEVKEGKTFAGSIAIPLAELRERVGEIPVDKPVVVHCAGGYRSAAGSSIIEALLDGKTQVFDLGEAVKTF